MVQKCINGIVSMKKRYNIVITGATGFVGSNLVRYILERDEADVVCLVRRSSNIVALQALPVTIAEVDFFNPTTLEPYIQNADYIFHLAAMTHAKSKEQIYKANRDMAQILFDLYKQHRENVKAYFFLSSLAAIGPKDFGFSDPLRTVDLHPLSQYGASKLEGEKLHWPFLNDPTYTIKIVRAPGIYGDGDKDVRQLFDMVKKGVMPVPLTGNGRVTLLHVRDMVRFAYDITLHSHECGIMSIHDGTEYSWNDIAKIARKTINRFAMKVWIPKRLMYFAAFVNEKFAKNDIFNREKCNEFTAMDWAYSHNDFSKIGIAPEWPLERGLRALYLKA